MSVRLVCRGCLAPSIHPSENQCVAKHGGMVEIKNTAEPVYAGRLKVILLLQVSSHNFEPTFIILVLICRRLADQPK